MARREITNWSQLQRFQPREIFTPRSEDELAAIVARAGLEGRRIKLMGAGHSFTAIAVTPDFHVTIHALDQLHHVDQSSGVVTVGAGITLKKLNRELDRYGLALTNMGDIDKQSIAGAVSTGTHGTGLAYGGIATQIRGLRMITPNGDVVDIDANHEPELFRCARVGLGALGIITRVTLQAVPSFRLHAVESSHSLDDVLEAWPDTIRSNDHAEFFFMPGGRNAARKINNRTDEPAAPLSRRRYIADKLVAENIGFGVIIRPNGVGPRLQHVVE
ncbi:MAG: FAD-binding protein [Actinobacteria bacterium]|nr:FAD-binding protein [Actinomycetota bacterium]